MPKHKEFASILFNPSSDIGCAQYMKLESNAAWTASGWINSGFVDMRRFGRVHSRGGSGNAILF
jgi:hypothetical protein